MVCHSMIKSVCDSTIGATSKIASRSSVRRIRETTPACRTKEDGGTPKSRVRNKTITYRTLVHLRRVTPLTHGKFGP
jgi:hypothetical protein